MATLLDRTASGEHELKSTVEDDLVAVTKTAEQGDPTPIVETE